MSESDQDVLETPRDGPENPTVKAEHGESKDKIKLPENPASVVKDEGKSKGKVTGVFLAIKRPCEIPSFLFAPI